jgi:uncharacterized protein (DUF305 family)
MTGARRAPGSRLSLCANSPGTELRNPASCRRSALVALVALVVASGIAGPNVEAQGSAARPRSGPAYTAADVQFMQGMIAHHSQALQMCGMAPTHDAGEKVSLFCKKVIISQRDEIQLMQTWLRDRGEIVPDPSASHAMSMPGMDMGEDSMLMPGMLTAAQMKQLDAARGVAWDTTFLKGMIQHHGGALTMVAALFASPGSGQTPEIFGFASGIDADQRAEIERMQGMLSTYERRSPK